MTFEQALAQMRSLVALWDRASAVAKLASLQFDPRNCSKSIRIELATYAVLRYSLANGGHTPSRDELAHLLETLVAPATRHLEDPLEGPAIWQVRLATIAPFVLAGGQPSLLFVIEPLYEAAGKLPREAGEAVQTVLRGTLAIAQGVYPSGCQVVGPAPRDIDFPEFNDAMIEAVSGQLLISPGMLRSAGLTTEIAESLLYALSDEAANLAAVAEPGSSRLLSTPILRQEGQFILVAPHLLARAAITLAVKTAAEFHVEAELAKAYADRLFLASAQHARLIGLKAVNGTCYTLADSGLQVRSALFLASQRRAVILTAVSHLPSWELLAVDSMPKLALSPDAQSAIRLLNLEYAKSGYEVEQVTHLAISGSPMSCMVDLTGCTNDEDQFMALNCEQLAGLAWSSNGPRKLTRFLDAMDRAQNDGIEIAMMPFDAFTAWSARESFYLSDGAKPTAIIGDGSTTSAWWNRICKTRTPHYRRDFEGRWQRVYRQGSNASLPIFASLDGSVFTDAGNTTWNFRVDQDEHGILGQMLAHWTWQLSLQPPLANVARQSKERIWIAVTVDGSDSFATSSTKEGVQIRVGEGMLKADPLAAEATLVRTAMPALYAPLGADMAAIAKAIADQLSANPLRRYLRDTRSSTMQVPKPDFPETYLHDAHKDWVMEWIGAYRTKAKPTPTGEFKGPKAKEIVHDVGLFLLKEYELEIAKLDASQALPFAVAANELHVYDQASAEFHRAMDEVLWGALPDFHEEHVSDWAEANRRALASRFLLETISAVQPSGKTKLDEDRYEQLLSLASMFSDWGRADEELFYEVEDLSVHVLRSGRTALSNDDGQARQRQLASELLQNGARSALADQQGGAGSLEPLKLEKLRPELDAYMQQACGMTFNQYTDSLGAFASHAFQQKPNVAHLSNAQARELVKAKANVDDTIADRFLAQVTLPLRGKLVPDKSMARHIFPWAFNRDLSVLWRPLLNDGSTGVWFGGLMLTEALLYQVHMLLQGRLTSKLTTAQLLRDKVAEARGAALTNAVYDLFDDEAHLRAKEVTEIGSLHLPEHLGDIDVLVLTPKERRVEVLEAKNHFMAKTPREIASQREDLFDDSNGPSYVSRHHARIEWTRANVSAILAANGIVDSEGWTVEGAIVIGTTNRHVHEPQSKVRIVAFPAFRHQVLTTRSTLAT